MRMTLKDKPRQCPECGSNKIARIIYGLQAYRPELERDLDNGKVVIGGCVITDCDPAWRCIDCRGQIYKGECVENLKKKHPVLNVFFDTFVLH